jgi:hypothetical protein
MPKLFGRPEDVQSGDGALQSTIVELRNVSDSLREGDPHAGAAARDLLSDLSAEFSLYFDAEESENYFGALLADRPRLKTEVGKLRDAHEGFRDSVGSLRRLAADESQDTRLAAGIDRVLDDFEEHEQAENALLQEFFLTDEGYGGE